MFGKPNWFRPKTFGWGLTPITWQGWAYTAAGAYTHRGMLTRAIPAAYRAGRRHGDDWDWAVATLNRYDPHRVFSNRFLDALL